MIVTLIKKTIYILSLTPGLIVSLPAESASKAPEATQQEIQEIRSENDLNVLEERFQADQDFDSAKVNEILKLRAIELGSITPLKKNIDAMLLLWDAGVREPNVFVATLLKDTQIDQTVVIHLYGPEVSALLNEMNANEPETLSANAKMIQSAFQTVETPA
ncbi:MAG: hypothetical protein ACOYK9_02210 [Chlamydiia bacterium]